MPKDKKIMAGLAQLKGMTFRDKAGHIWEYYKLHLFLALIVLFMIGYFINTLVLNPAKKPYVELAILDVFTVEEVRERIAADLGAALIPESERDKYMVRMDDFFIMEGISDEYTQIILSKFAAMVVTREIDIMLIGGRSMDGLGDQGVFADLSGIIEAFGMDARADQIVRRAFADPDDMTGDGKTDEYPCALRLGGDNYFTAYGIDASGMYLAVLTGNEGKEAVMEAIKYIMGW